MSKESDIDPKEEELTTIYGSELLPHLQICQININYPKEINVIEKKRNNVNNKFFPDVELKQSFVENTIVSKLLVNFIKKNDRNNEYNLCDEIEIALPKSLILPESFEYKIVKNEHIEIQFETKELNKKNNPSESLNLKRVLFENTEIIDRLLKTELPKIKKKQHFFCKDCNESFSSTSKELNIYDKIKKMPSDHWVELSELWICHNPDSFQHFPREQLQAIPNMLLVGGTFILIHPDQCNQDSLYVKNGSSTSSNNDDELDEYAINIPFERFDFKSTIHCSNCNNFLGFVQYDQNKDKISGYQVFKYRISTIKLLNDEENKQIVDQQNCFFRDTLEGRFSKQFLSLTHKNAIFRIRIYGNFDKKLYLQIQLLNWTTKLQTNLFSVIKKKYNENNNNNEDDIEEECLRDYRFNHDENSNPILKLMYIDCRMREKKSISKEINKWNTLIIQNGIEDLYLIEEEINLLLEMLKRNSIVFPDSLNKIKNYHVSFLRFDNV